MEAVQARAAAWRERYPMPGALVALLARTVRSISRARVVGLAAESAFFSLLSLPALMLGLVGTLGHMQPLLGRDTVLEIRGWMLDLAASALTSETVDTLVAPLVDEFLQGAQGGLLSVTFLVSLWSGSRAMNVFIDAITIAYGLDELRSYLGRRVLALVSYLGGLLFALLVLPIMVAGPDMVHRLLPATVGYLHLLYWPLVGALSTLAVAMLYMLSTPVHTPLWRYLPGALAAMLILLIGSGALRVYLDASFGQVTIYGSLAAPIAVLVWLWVMALAVLIGSALNAEIDAMWPTPRTASARAEIAARRHERARRMVQRREEALQATGAPDVPTETSAELAARMWRRLSWGDDRESEDTDPGPGAAGARRGGPAPRSGEPGGAEGGAAAGRHEAGAAQAGSWRPAQQDDGDGPSEPEPGETAEPADRPPGSFGGRSSSVDGDSGPRPHPREEDRQSPGASS